jgi:hypothetical protein
MKNDKEQLKVFSVRAEQDKIELAHFHNIDLGVLFRQALDEELMRRQGKCPRCGTKIKWEAVK